MCVHRIGGNKRESLWRVALALLCLIAIPCRLLADDKGSSDGPSKSPTKVVGPVPLTERERMLLDRLEELEKRVADLEANKQPAPNSTSPATPEVAATPAGNAQPASVKAVGVPGPSDVASAGAGSVVPATTTATSGVSSSTTPAGGNVMSDDQVMASIGPPQATDKGKSGAAKPASEEPFSFADFTWLNGNARTKDIPMDTKFFTPEIRSDVDYVYDFNHPKDDTIGGSSEVFRSDEVQVTQQIGRA